MFANHIAFEPEACVWLSVPARLVLERLKKQHLYLLHDYMAVLAALFDVLVDENVKSSGVSV